MGAWKTHERVSEADQARKLAGRHQTGLEIRLQKHQNIVNKEGRNSGREELQRPAEDEVRIEIIKTKKAKGHR